MDGTTLVAALTAAGLGWLLAARVWRQRQQQRLSRQLRVSKETIARLRRREDATPTAP